MFCSISLTNLRVDFTKHSSCPFTEQHEIWTHTLKWPHRFVSNWYSGLQSDAVFTLGLWACRDKPVNKPQTSLMKHVLSLNNFGTGRISNMWSCLWKTQLNNCFMWKLILHNLHNIFRKCGLDILSSLTVFCHIKGLLNRGAPKNKFLKKKSN